MKVFDTLTGIAAPLPIANVDTDMILPAAFLTTLTRAGLGRHLFHNVRYDGEGRPRPNFILNRAPWTDARILVALANFGCGSSREHAPWALLDFGIRCIIAPSFAEIFEANCVKNGMLPARLRPAQVDELLRLVADPASARLTVDLVKCTVSAGNLEFRFEVGGRQREQLLCGQDDISVSLGHERSIAAYEERLLREQPWLARTGLRPGSSLLCS